MERRDEYLTLDEVAALAARVNQWEQREDHTPRYGVERTIAGRIGGAHAQDATIVVTTFNINPVLGSSGSGTPMYGYGVRVDGVLVTDPSYSDKEEVEQRWRTLGTDKREEVQDLCRRLGGLYTTVETTRFNASVRAARERIRQS